MIKWFKTLFRIVRNYDALDKAQKNASKYNQSYRTDAAAKFETIERRLDDLKGAVSTAESAWRSAKAAEKFIRARTEVHASVNMRERRPNSIIVVGRYKNRDYVEVFDVDSIEAVVNQFRDMQRHHHRGIVDGPPQFNAFIDSAIDWEEK